MPSEDDRFSCYSFAVGYVDMLADLSPARMFVALKAVVDDTPGLASALRYSVRDQAFRDLALLYGRPTSATEPDKAYSRYLSGAWLRDQDVGLPDEASEERVLLFKAAMANRGDSIGYFQIRNILLGRRGERI